MTILKVIGIVQSGMIALAAIVTLATPSHFVLKAAVPFTNPTQYDAFIRNYYDLTAYTENPTRTIGLLIILFLGLSGLVVFSLLRDRREPVLIVNTKEKDAQSNNKERSEDADE